MSQLGVVACGKFRANPTGSIMRSCLAYAVDEDDNQACCQRLRYTCMFKVHGR